MSSGFSFRADQVWLVRSSLAEPVIELVAQRVAPVDPDLADWVRAGITFQSVDLDLLEPPRSEQVRAAVVDVVRSLLADDDRLAALDPSPAPPGGAGPEDDLGRRRATLGRLLDLAESPAEPEAAGEPDPGGA